MTFDTYHTIIFLQLDRSALWGHRARSLLLLLHISTASLTRRRRPKATPRRLLILQLVYILQLTTSHVAITGSRNFVVKVLLLHVLLMLLAAGECFLVLFLLNFEDLLVL